MKALVYNGPGKKALEDRPKPDVTAPTDAIVKIVKTTICGIIPATGLFRHLPTNVPKSAGRVSVGASFGGIIRAFETPTNVQD